VTALIVSVDELRDHMSSIGLDADQEKDAEVVLRGVQRALERHLQRDLALVERTETITPDEFGRLWPRATPVRSVSTPGLYPNGNMLGGHYVASPFGGPVVVTYVGGIDGEDEDDVRLAILRVAAREMATNHDDVLTNAELSTTTPPKRDTRALGWTKDELAEFDRLRRRTVV
jgi:hypothetical protein